MHFISPALEQLFKSYKYARNNSIKIFDEAVKQDVLGFHSTSKKQTDYSFQSILFQFQCLVSTTDTYYRRLTNARNNDFGVYVTEDKIIPKQELSAEVIKKILPQQLEEIEELLKSFDEEKAEKVIDKIGMFGNHEYLHQGQLILMFREAGAKLPESYVKVWAL